MRYILLIDVKGHIFSFQVVDVRIGAMTSFITIIYLLVQQVYANEQSQKIDFIQMSLSKIMPWTMGQHFNLRLYAQVVAKKLMLLRDCTDLKSSDVICGSLSTILSYGNAAKFVKKVEEDIFLTDFNIMKHLSLEIIFYVLPKLTNYTYEDIIHPSLFTKLCSSDNYEHENVISLYNRGSSLDQAQFSAWGVNLQSMEKSSEELEHEADLNIQQKITPWRSMDVVESGDNLYGENVFNVVIL